MESQTPPIDLDDKGSLHHIEALSGRYADKELIARSSANVDESRIKLSAATWLACFFGAFNVFTQLVILTGPSNIISFLVSDLGRPDLSVWIIQAPVIVQGALSPFVGRLSDEVGRKWLICIAPLFGIVGCIICSQAQTMQMLIAGSVIAGIAQTTVGLCVSIPAEVLPNRLRAVSQSFIQVAGSCASTLAALGTGGFVQNNPAGWRNFYYTCIALMALSSIGPFFFYNPPPRIGSLKPVRTIIHECDLVGTFGIAASVTGIIVGINYGSSTYGYNNPHFYGPFIVGVLSVALTTIYEGWFRKDGIFHHDLFSHTKRNFSIAAFCLFIEGWLYFSGVAAYYPQMVRYLGWETDSFYIGLRKFAFSATGFVLIIPIIWIVTKTKNVQYILCFAFCAYLSSMAAFSTFGPEDVYTSIVAICIASIGMTPQLILLTMTIQLASPPHLIATASSLGLTIRGIGGAFGSAVMASQVNQRMAKNLAPAIVPLAIANGLPASSAGALVGAFRSSALPTIRRVPGITQPIIDLLFPIVRETYADAFRWAFITCLPACVLGGISILFLDGKKIKARMNGVVDATAEKVNIEEARFQREKVHPEETAGQ